MNREWRLTLTCSLCDSEITAQGDRPVVDWFVSGFLTKHTAGRCSD